MTVFIFLLMNLIVGSSSFIITYKLLRLSHFTDSLIAWFILFFSQVILTELILGVIGALYLTNVILLNLAVFLILWKISGKRRSSFNPGPLRGTLEAFSVNKIIAFAACAILCFSAVKVFINLVNPPFGWDSLNYHFTFPVEWLKHGNLENPIVISDDPSPSYYPIGASLFFLWLIFPFKSVFLADVGQVPFFILAFLAVYNISRKINLSEELSFYAAALFILIPNLFKQLQIAYVDVIVAALFLSSLNFLFSLNKEFSFQNVFAWSVSLGLLLSTKTVALPYAALLFLPFIYLSFKNAAKAHLFIASVLIVIAIGGYSYIRNFIETGNPLYPLGINLFGNPILRGVIDSNTYRAHFRMEDYRLSKLLFHEGLGLQTLFLIFPAALLALPVTLLKKRRALNFNFTYFLILPLLIYFVYRYLIPLANTRYLYPLLGLGVILGFYILAELNTPKQLINSLVVICILSSMGELAKRNELVISLISVILFFPVSLAAIRRKWKLSIKKPLIIPVLCASAVFLLIFMSGAYIRNEYPGYVKMIKYSGFWPDAVRAWEWLNKNTQGNNIAYAGRPVPFPLYGTNFKNNVYYVSVNKTDPAKLHYFTESHYNWGYDFMSLHSNLKAQGNYRGNADYTDWSNNLIRRKTDYLFIYSLHQTKDIEFSVEDGWARADTARFSPVFTNQTIHIYKILQ